MKFLVGTCNHMLSCWKQSDCSAGWQFSLGLTLGFVSPSLQVERLFAAHKTVVLLVRWLLGAVWSRCGMEIYLRFDAGFCWSRPLCRRVIWNSQQVVLLVRCVHGPAVRRYVTAIDLRLDAGICWHKSEVMSWLIVYAWFFLRCVILILFWLL